MTNIEICNTFLKFCKKGKYIQSNLSLDALSTKISEWANINNLLKGELIQSLIESGFKLNKELTKTNILYSESIPFSKKTGISQLKGIEYFVFWHPEKEKLNIIHNYISYIIKSKSKEFDCPKYKRLPNTNYTGNRRNYGSNINTWNKFLMIQTGTVTKQFFPSYIEFNIFDDKEYMFYIDYFNYKHYINLDTNIMCPGIEQFSKMKTIFSELSPHYIQFLEKLLKIKPNIDLNCEENLICSI